MQKMFTQATALWCYFDIVSVSKQLVSTNYYFLNFSKACVNMNNIHFLFIFRDDKAKLVLKNVSPHSYIDNGTNDTGVNLGFRTWLVEMHQQAFQVTHGKHRLVFERESLH